MPKEWSENKERYVDSPFPIEFDYGIQATPVRPLPKNRLTDYQVFHMDATAQKVEDIFKEFEESEEKGRELIKAIAENGVQYFLILGWVEIMNTLKPFHEEKFKKFVSICHEYGLKVMAYTGYEYATARPDWSEKAHTYLLKNTKGRLCDGWLMPPPLHPWHRAYTVCMNSKFANEFIEEVAYAMDNYGIDAIYIDGGFNPWECANESHGCGYRDKEGNLHHTYPIFGVREFAKKLYKTVHDRGGILEVHQSATCTVTTMAFTDLSFTGENIQGLIIDNPKYLRYDAFRAEHCGINTGINTQFMAIEQDEVGISTFAAITLIHGVMPMPRLKVKGTLEYMGKIWTAHHEFGIDKAEWKPYWKAYPIRSDQDDVYVSVYEREDAYLAVVSSTNDSQVKAKLIVNGTATSARNMISDAVYPVTCGTIDVELNPYQVELIQINK